MQTHTLDLTPGQILADYETACTSRECSLLGFKEVMGGRAKFGIFGDGKEVAQVALAHAFAPGDLRAGYYRDQTLMMALGLFHPEHFFAQLYAHPDLEHEPWCGGRQMNAHFATRMLDAEGRWLPQVDRYVVPCDNSPTGCQMPRLVGLAYASKLFRQLPGLEHLTSFSDGGNEVAFGTIGDASCAEGMFWEAVNAAGVLQIPMLLSIWDDGYGISVPGKYQITKQDISKLLGHFQRPPDSRQGFDIYRVRGWDYPALYGTYQIATGKARLEHVPALVHVPELTQPQGHSTSGSHERYKPPERLEWEREFDCLRKMREWLLESGLATDGELQEIEQRSRARVQEARERAWKAFRAPIDLDQREVLERLRALAAAGKPTGELEAICQRLEGHGNPLRRDLVAALWEALVLVRESDSPQRRQVVELEHRLQEEGHARYSTHLYCETAEATLRVEPVPPRYAEDAREVSAFEVINACFDDILRRHPEVIAFGEDVGKIGDVNQGFRGLQEKYGELRVTDTGIRECTILGQAIGLALRGFRPIAEIQYLDYLLYALQLMSDDLATLRYRTAGGQKAPVVVRTRGHRLEGIWHSGSPMAGIIHLVRGMYVCVPRDMTRAAGFYNTLLQGADPGLVVEVLSGYRLKEKMPANIGELSLPLGVPEVLREGTDVTLVTYGACCRIALAACELLARVGIEVELIDVQTLLPFDLEGVLLESLRKTSRVLFLDEDVPGGTTAYMLQELLEVQDGYSWLDAPPRTLSSRPHRPAYGSDGDYWSKPNREQIFAAVYDLMHEGNPRAYPRFHR